MSAIDGFSLGFAEAPAHFESPSQKARVWTEQWVHGALFCPNCGARRFERFAANREAADFYCAACDEQFELKSQKGRFGRKVVDGAYAAVTRRIAASNNPNLILLSYDLAAFGVTDVQVVPKHFFVQEIVEQRKPLAPTARRAGWVGCNILLDRVPAAGRIFMVRERAITPKEAVLEQWRETLFLRDQSLAARGWLVEVMKTVEAIGRREFTLADVYTQEARLQALFPANHNVRPKIRQQLQVLRDQGFLTFIGQGRYRLTRAAP